MDERTQQLLEKLGVTAKDTSGAMQQLISALSRSASATSNQTNAATISAQSLQQLQSSAQSTASNLRNVLSIGTGVVSQFTSLTSTVYGAEKAFTSVIPALDFITNTFTKSVTAAGSALSGTSIAGMSFGKASEAAAAGVVATFEVLSNVIKFQIDSAQKVADQFVALSKVGANFGGSIGAMGADAAMLRIPLLEFGRIITTNVENLTKMGKSVRDAGFDVANYAAGLYSSSDALVALYGNVENISAGVADFLASQAQLGMADVKREVDFNNQRNAIKEYLIRQKELTAITGQSADALKKAEEERRKDLAYQLKVSRMSTTAQANVSEGMAIAQTKFGDEAARYLQEYIRTNGKITDPAMISFAAGNQEVARTMQMFAENVNLSTTDFRRNYAGFIKENAGAYRGFAESVEDLAELPPSLKNNFVQSQTRMGASLIANQNFFEQLPITIERMIAEGTDMRGVLTDAASKAFVDAERGRSRVQREIDISVLENMRNIGSTMEYLNQITLSMVQGQGSINKLLEKLKEVPQTAADFNKSVGNMVDDIFRRMGIELPNSPERGSGSDVLSILREIFSGNRTLPVSVNPGQSPIPVSVVSGQGTPTAQAGSPSSPSTSVAALTAADVDLLVALNRRNQDNTSSSENNVVMAMYERLQSQVAAISAASGNTEQVVAALTDQNGLIATLNDKMSEMVDSNRSIFNALA
jgi:hypothetical protein